MNGFPTLIECVAQQGQLLGMDSVVLTGQIFDPRLADDQ